MKRVYICMGIFALIITLSIFSLHTLDKNNRELNYRIDELITLYESKSPDTLNKALEFEEFWHDYYKKISFIETTCSLNNVSNSVAKLSQLISQNSDDLIVECDTIKKWAELTYMNQFPYFHSIF